jgi:hypothetical protein
MSASGVTPVFRMRPAAFISRFVVVGANRPLEAGANAWVKENVGSGNDVRSETMIRNAYATGLKVWVPNADIEPSPKRYFYGPGTGHMALDEDGRFVLVDDSGRSVYMSSVACYEADVYHALLRARRIWVGTITAFDRSTGLVSVSFLDSKVDPIELVKLVSKEPVTDAGTERPSFYIVDTSHLSSSLLGRKARGYTYLNARPDDTYPEARYEHVSTGSTSHAASDHETARTVESVESDEAEPESVESEPAESDTEFDQWLLNRIHAPPTPPVPRLIYSPLWRPPRGQRPRRASKRSR